MKDRIFWAVDPTGIGVSETKQSAMEKKTIRFGGLMSFIPIPNVTTLHLLQKALGKSRLSTTLVSLQVALTIVNLALATCIHQAGMSRFCSILMETTWKQSGMETTPVNAHVELRL